MQENWRLGRNYSEISEVNFFAHSRRGFRRSQSVHRFRNYDRGPQGFPARPKSASNSILLRISEKSRKWLFWRAFWVMKGWSQCTVELPGPDQFARDCLERLDGEIWAANWCV